jgi:hypothetical protein
MTEGRKGWGEGRRIHLTLLLSVFVPLADKTTLTRTIAHFPSDSPGGVGRRGGRPVSREGGEDAGVLTERREASLKGGWRMQGC